MDYMYLVDVSNSINYCLYYCSRVTETEKGNCSREIETEKKLFGNVIKSFLLLYANMVCGWFWSKVYLVTTMGLSILLKKLPV